MDNKQRVREAYEVFLKGETALFCSIFSDHTRLTEASHLPYGGTFYGRRAISHVVEKVMQTWNFIDFRIESIAANGEWVYVYSNIVAQSRATGAEWAHPRVDIWRIEDDEVTELQVCYFDSAAIGDMTLGKGFVSVDDQQDGWGYFADNKPKGKLTTADKHKIVEDAYGCFMTGNPDDYYSMFDDDSILTEAASLPYGGVYRGADDIKVGISNVPTIWPMIGGQIKGYASDGDYVFVNMVVTCKSATTGKTWSMTGVEVIIFRNDRVSELRPFYFDTDLCRKALA